MATPAKVRCRVTVNIVGARVGDVVRVDPTKPWVAKLLGSGVLVRVNDEPTAPTAPTAAAAAPTFAEALAGAPPSPQEPAGGAAEPGTDSGAPRDAADA